MTNTKDAQARRAKRRYRGTVQAEVAALTRQRIIEAVLALFEDKWIDQITFEQIAERAGVTTQTIIRHFTNKEGVLAAASEQAYRQGLAQRDQAPAGDVPAAIRNLIEHYEAVGDRGLRALAQEGAYPALRSMNDAGRSAHRAWNERVFGAFLKTAGTSTRERLLAELVAVTDVYVWKLLRRDQGLTRDETEQALQEIVSGVLQRAKPG